MTQRGLDADYAAKWIAYADANAIDDYRGLTEQAILAMLSLSYISDDQARTMLLGIHKGSAAIDELIAYGHIQRTIQSANQSISRVGSLYQGRKITAQSATTALTTLGVEPSAIPTIIADWDAIVNVNVKLLTAAEIADAWEYEIIDDTTAYQELQNIGYTPYDSWVYLSIKNKAPLPGQPASGPGAPLGAVTPGTT
jgi:DNA-binding MarR family transcriptional regulator